MLKHAAVQSADSSWFYLKNAVHALLMRDSGSKRLQILSKLIQVTCFSSKMLQKTCKWEISASKCSTWQILALTCNKQQGRLPQTEKLHGGKSHIPARWMLHMAYALTRTSRPWRLSGFGPSALPCNMTLQYHAIYDIGVMLDGDYTNIQYDIYSYYWDLGNYFPVKNLAAKNPRVSHPIQSKLNRSHFHGIRWILR